MFTLPSLPTDSLYKFIFVSGVVLVVLSMYFMNSSSESSLNQSLKIDSLLWKKTTQHSIDSSKYMFILKGAKEKLFNVKDAKELLNEVEIRSSEEEKLNNLIKSEVGRTARIREDFKKRDESSWFCFAIGGFFMCLGIYKWVKEVQLPQDRLLQIQVLLAEKELENASIKQLANKYNRFYGK